MAAHIEVQDAPSGGFRLGRVPQLIGRLRRPAEITPLARPTSGPSDPRSPVPLHEAMAVGLGCDMRGRRLGPAPEWM